MNRMPLIGACLRQWMTVLALLLLPLWLGGNVAQAQVGAEFDHSTTGFMISGPHNLVRCEQCHVNGVFKGTPRDCASCHGWNNPRSTVVKSTSHLPTTAACETCHFPSASHFQDAVFTHAGVRAKTCTDCHAGQYPQIKAAPADATHAAATNQGLSCDSCHTVGSFAAPKPPVNHIPFAATASCQSCHVAADYAVMPDVGTIHANAQSKTANCAQCHSSQNAAYYAMPTMVPALVAPPGNHIGMGSQGCEACHVGALTSIGTTPVPTGSHFSGSRFSHGGIGSGCADCHGATVAPSSFYGVTAIVQMPTGIGPSTTAHIPTTAACETCHTNAPGNLLSVAAVPAIGATGFRSSLPGTAAVHTGISSGCSACHDTNAVWLGMSLYPPNFGTYTGFQSRPLIGGSTYAAADAGHPASGDCSQCHVGISFNPNAVQKPSNHIPVASNSVCSNCHVSDYSVMPSITQIHQYAPSGGANCVQCHSTQNAALYAMPTMSPEIVAPPSTHIPMGSLGCEACHVGANSGIPGSVVNGARFSNSAFSHTGISSGCSTCHGASAGPFYGVVPKNINSLTPGHVAFSPAIDCVTCHTNNVPSTPVPYTGATAGMTTFAGGGFIHTGISSACASCHGPSTAPSAFYGLSTMVVMPASSDPTTGTSHIPSGTTCENCHVAPSGLVTTFGTPSSNGFANVPPTTQQIHAGMTGGCASCHESGYLWVGMAPAYTISRTAPFTGFQTRPAATQLSAFTVVDAGHPSSGDCANCHGSILDFTGPSKPANHIPIAGAAACTACHTSSDYSVMPTLYAIHTNTTSVNSGCASCHSTANAAIYNQLSSMQPQIVSPPANHIDMGSLGCESCHVGSNSSMTLPVQASSKFSNSAFLHSGMAKACADCHGASVTPSTFYGVAPQTIGSLSPGHVPTALACSTCHVNTPSTLVPATGGGGAANFGNAKFTHTGIVSGCATCHDSGISGSTFYGLPSIVVMPPTSPMGASSHIPTGTTCESCHTAPSGFVNTVVPAPGSGFRSPAPTTQQIHSGMTGSCNDCHETNYTWMGVAAVYPISTVAPFTGFQTRPQANAGTSNVSDSGHTGVGDCSACHGSILDFTGVSKPSNHIPVSASSSCTNCHTNADYSVMPARNLIHQYAPSSSTNCAQCHSAANAAAYALPTLAIVAPASNHIDMGGLGCEACHIASIPVGANSTFAGAYFSHAGSGVTGNCAACHDSSVTTGTFQGNNGGFRPKTNDLTPGHIPIMAPVGCDTCHINSLPSTLVPASGATGSMATFANAKFTHSGVTWGCVNCHGDAVVANGSATGGTFYGITAIVRAGMSTTSPATPGPLVHLPTATTCENCHAGSTPSGLIGANATNAPQSSGFATPAPTSPTIHAGISGGCANCHEQNMVWMGMAPAYNISTAAPYTGFQTRPLTTTSGQFFVMDAGHPGLASGDCSKCHGSFTDFTAPSKPSNHIPVATTATCTACHTSSDYSVMPTLVNIHANAPSTSTNCAQCHSAAAAITYAMASMSPALVGVPSDHMPMGTLGCEACHVATGSNVSVPVQNGAKFTNSGFSHTGITGSCSNCHGNFSASGVALASAGFNASGTTPRSIVSAAGLTPAHIPTTLDCSVCHTGIPTALIPFANSGGFSFAGGQFSHTQTPLACINCHISGTGYNGPFKGVTVVQVAIPSAGGAASASTHLPTSTACELCHAAAVPSTLLPVSTVPSMGSSGFRLQPPASTAIHANTSASCNNCHEKYNQWLSMDLYPISSTAPFTGFQTRPASPASTSFTVLDGAHPSTTAVQCSACHGSMSDFSATAKPTTHIPTASNAACTACHTSVDYTVPPLWSNIHANAPSSSSGCASCHEAANATTYSTATVTIKSQGSDHMSMGTLGCESCHTASIPVANNSSFKNAGFLHSGMTVACAVCHGAVGGSAPQYSASGATPLTAKSTATLSPVHVPVSASMSCANCHTTPTMIIPYGSTTTASFAAGKFDHSASTTGCAICHGSGVNSSSFFGITSMVVLSNYNLPSGSSNHIPLLGSTACEGCHSQNLPSTPSTVPATTPALGSTKFLTPAPTTGQIHAGISGSCATCHEGGKSWLDTSQYPPSSLSYSAGGVYTGFLTRPSSAGGTGTTVNDPIHPLLATGDCSKCHGSTADFSITAKPSNHIPYVSSATCVSCHTQMGNTNDFSIFPAWTDIHTYAPTPSGNCAQCHSAANAAAYAIPSVSFTIKAPPATHVPLAGSTACETCHVGTGSSLATATAISNTMSFANSKYSHTGISTGCASCHGAGISGSSFAGIPAIVAIPASSNTNGANNHIPYATACESCHLTNLPSGQAALPSSVSVTSGNTGFKLTLTSASNAAVHSGMSSGCNTCHEKNYTWLGMSQSSYTPNSVSTGAATYTGFLTRPYASPSSPFAVNDAGHAVGSLATSDCAQCHGSTAAFSAAAKPSGHMHNATAACSTCHLSSAAGEYGTPTLTTPANLHPNITATVSKLTVLPAVADLSCVACHTTWTAGTSNRAPFAGCTTAQAACASPVPVTYLPMQTSAVSAHVPIAALDCTGCHGSVSTFASTTMGSTGHSNAKLAAIACQSCHERGMAWTNVSSFQVRPTNHTGSKAAPNDCVKCHSYNAGGFRGLVKPTARSAIVNPNINRLRPTAANSLTSRGLLGNSFNHQGVQVGQCKTCHDGQRASGLPARHLMVTTSCDTCHRTSAWTPAQFSHNGVPANTCMACHNGINATTKSNGHFITARSCDSCHKTAAWTPVTYSHLAAAYQPGPSSLTCVSCHITNSEVIPRQMRGLVRSKPTPVGP